MSLILTRKMTMALTCLASRRRGSFVGLSRQVLAGPQLEIGSPFR